MATLFGGGKSQRRAAELARQQQQVANERQLAELRASDQRSAASRRSPRGRRLFVSDAATKETIA